MLFETQKYNYVFILSIWAFTFVLDMMLRSVPPLNLVNPGNPPDVVLYFSTIVYSIFGIYIGICLMMLTYNGILGPKLKKSVKNLTVYGIRSFATLVLVFTDLVSFMATEHDFVTRTFNLSNMLPQWQEIFVIAGFPIIGLFLTWNFRNLKLEYR